MGNTLLKRVIGLIWGSLFIYSNLLGTRLNNTQKKNMIAIENMPNSQREFFLWKKRGLDFATAVFLWNLDIIKITENLAQTVHRQKAFKG